MPTIIPITDPDSDLECPCGNDAEYMGFSPSIDGKECEPTADSNWNGEYLCNKCGAIHR